MMNSLELIKQKETKVVVAMSGGVDFSRSALMKEEGYDVTVTTLKLYDDTNNLVKADNAVLDKIY